MKTFVPMFFLTGILAMSINGTALGSIIFQNAITDTNPSLANPFTAGQSFDPDITVSGIGRGSGIGANTGANRYNARNWTLSSSTPDASDYFTFVLTPNAGKEIDFTDFVYTGQASDTGPIAFVFRSSVDGFATDVGTPIVGGATISLMAAAFQNITSAIEFRFYGYGGSNVAGTFSINDFTFNGEVNDFTAAVPEPASIGIWGLVLAGFAGGGLLSRKRQAAASV